MTKYLSLTCSIDQTDGTKLVNSFPIEKNVERFIAIDGRCKNAKAVDCEAKKKTFEMIYDVRIPVKNEKVQNVLPRSSITLGTLLILRQMIKKKWKRILVCEDDIVLGRDIERKFSQGIKEIGSKKWDLLYLGCGSTCGVNDISIEKTKKNKHISTWVDYDGDEEYTRHPNDLRTVCYDEDICVPITKHISRAYRPGGTWCYAYSLSGAKKIIKAIGKDVSRHIDQLIINETKNDIVKALVFDPPIVWHENMRKGKYDSDNPWLNT